MATIPMATATLAVSDEGEKPPAAKLPRERAATKGWRHLMFGSGPLFYRLLRFAQRNVGQRP